MIHDLLLALVGFTGDIVESDPDSRELVLAPQVKLESFDRDIVEGILALGSLYVKIRDWADKQLRETTSFVYDLVIAKALDEEILREYEEDIAKFEEKILSLADCGENGGMTLSSLRLALWDRWWAALELIAAHAVVEASPNVIEHIMSANSRFRCDKMSLIEKRLLDCFGRELDSWCRHGVIAGGERSQFFIRQVEGSPQIDQARIPMKLIDPDTCTQILFCGKTVLVLKNGVESAYVSQECKSVFKNISPKNASQVIPKDVETVRSFLSAKLGKRMKHDMQPGLVDHLKNLRGFFLMGFGEKWAALVSSLFIVVDPNRIPALFDDIFHQTSTCSLSPTMELKYHLPWPMQLVVPGFEKYQEVFSLLFKVLAASVKARSCFNMQLNNLFSSLSAYLQLDLIETSFAKLLKVTESDDIQLIIAAHSIFITEVHAGCLAGVEHVWDIIDALVALNDRVLKNPGGGYAIDALISQTVRKLIDELQILQSRTMYSSIERLILKLDFNHFYRPSMVS